MKVTPKNGLQGGLQPALQPIFRDFLLQWCNSQTYHIQPLRRIHISMLKGMMTIKDSIKIKTGCSVQLE